MNWDAIGVIAELISALAVVVTLVYLIVEIRQNRLVAESASVDLLAAGWNILNNQIIADPEFAHVLFEGFANPDSLDPIQRDRFFLTVQSYVNHFMTVKKHYDAGQLPEEEWLYHSVGFSHLMNSPGGKMVAEKAAMTPSVQAVLEKYEGQTGDGYFSALDGRDSEPPPNKSSNSGA